MAKSRIARVGNKFYDMGTSNKSFLQLAKDLKTVGIKNFYFMLEIYDYSLITVDPYACDKFGHTTLTQDQVSRIMVEIARNPWYYLREIARIPDQGGTAVPYKANRGNIAQAWCFFKGLDSWLCLPRQRGKTVSALTDQTYAYSFGTTNSKFIFVNKDGDNAKANLRSMTDQIALLPEYLRFDSYLDDDTGKRTKARINATRIEHPVNHNSVIVKPKATSYDNALSLARGLTAPILHFDEPEFTPHIKTIVENSVSTFDTAASNAKANGAMYGRIFTCTPGDLSTNPGQESQALLDKCAKWTEKLYDMTDEQIHEYIDSQGDECNGILYIEYQYYQIGMTEEWLKNISAKIGNPLVVRREILLQRLHGSSLSPYDQEDIEYIVSMEKKPIDEMWILEYYRFDIYSDLNPKKAYIAGVDCSTGTNSDHNAITIIDPITVEPVAEFECSYIGETKFEQLLIALVDKLPKLVLCIERNSVGDGIIDHLIHSRISSRIYFDKNKDLNSQTMKENETYESMLKKQAQIKTFYGVWTGQTSRETMFAILSRHVNEFKEKFVSHNVIRDLTRLVRTPSGKIEAGKSTDDTGEPFHDDSIMSYLIALYVFYHGNNLPLFGIFKGLDEAEEKNAGLKMPEEIDPSLVNPRIIEEVKKQVELENVPKWEDMMREAMEKAQKESYEISKRGSVKNDLYANTPQEALDSLEDDGGSIDLSFFNSLNGF